MAPPQGGTPHDEPMRGLRGWDCLFCGFRPYNLAVLKTIFNFVLGSPPPPLPRGGPGGGSGLSFSRGSVWTYIRSPAPHCAAPWSTMETRRGTAGNGCPFPAVPSDGNGWERAPVHSRSQPLPSLGMAGNVCHVAFPCCIIYCYIRCCLALHHKMVHTLLPFL